MTNFLFKDSAKERAEQVFLALDFNRDGELCENEFVTGCLQVLKQKKTKDKNVNKDISTEMANSVKMSLSLAACRF